MCELKKKYPREEESIKFPIYNEKKDTTESVLQC